MCTYGITCRGILQTYADYVPGAFRQHVARFSSPVYPGETVTMDLWKDGNVISFETRGKPRNVAVIKSGTTRLGRDFRHSGPRAGANPESPDSWSSLSDHPAI